MWIFDLLEVGLLVAVLILLAAPLGSFLHRIFSGERCFLSPVLRPVESLIYAGLGVDPKQEMSWKAYAASVAVFNAAGFCLLLAILLSQGALPWNPEGLPGLKFPLAVNTAVSFVTNTNWQAYSGESTLSYFSQMLGLTVQNFLSAATGVAVVLAFIRGLARASASTLGNFWVDLTRCVLYVLLPLAIVLAILLAGQGVVQNLGPYQKAVTLEGAEQVIPAGPAASQIAIKQLGTNGGGFFGVNSAHPLENPTPVSNFLQVLAILILPAGLTILFGKMVCDGRQGWCLFAVMLAIFLGGFALSWWAESQPNPLTGVPLNMEGKEQRFGIMNSVLWSTATTATSNGSVNAMHSSLSPLAGMVAMLNIMLGEVIFGGVGSGLYGMFLLVLLTVFLAGLMVGRTPEYLGKKIEAREIRLAVVGVLVPSALILVGSALASVSPAGLASLANAGPHGLSEILYAVSSAAGNNGSAFAGLSADTPFYNYLLAACMAIGRFAVIIPVLALAGGLVGKKASPPSSGTLPTDGVTFAVLLTAVIFIVGALTFLPALTLGPIVEHVLMLEIRSF